MSNSFGFFFFVLVSEAMGIVVLGETLKGDVWKVSSELGSGVLASPSVLLSIELIYFYLGLCLVFAAVAGLSLVAA